MLRFWMAQDENKQGSDRHECDLGNGDPGMASCRCESAIDAAPQWLVRGPAAP